MYTVKKNLHIYFPQLVRNFSFYGCIANTFQYHTGNRYSFSVPLAMPQSCLFFTNYIYICILFSTNTTKLVITVNFYNTGNYIPLFKSMFGMFVLQNKKFWTSHVLVIKNSTK